MGIQITFMSAVYGGGSGSDSVTSQDYANAGAAVAAISDGFLVVPNPVDQGQTASDGKARAFSAATIHDIRSI